MGIKVINEFGIDITNNVTVSTKNGETIVTDEFGSDITNIVNIIK